MKLNKIILLGAILSATNITSANAAKKQEPPSNQDLQRQLDALKKMVTDQAREIAELRKSANLSPKLKENPSSPPISVPSKEIIDVYGYLRLDTIWDRSLPNNSQSPLYILSPSNPNKGSNANGGISIHPRLSRLGFNFNSTSHDNSRIKVGGKLELDWQNGAGLTAESRPIPRIRHAYMTLKKGDGTLLLGQTWDVISPLIPAANDDTLMWNTGNIGDRRAQIRYTYEPKKSRFNAAVAFGLTGAVDQKDLDNNGVRDGEDSSLPNIQSRIQYKNRDSQFGVWGHFAWERTTKAVAGRHRFTGYSVGFDGVQKLSSNLTASGEFWIGQNLSDFRGGIGQGVISATGTEVRSHGGWLELGYQVSPNYRLSAGFSGETPERNDIPTGGRIDNNAFYLHNRFKLTNNVDLGATYYYWTTRYRDQSSGIDHRFQLYVMHNF